MTSGGQYVVTSGVDLILQLFVNNLDILTLEVSVAYDCVIECVCDSHVLTFHMSERKCIKSLISKFDSVVANPVLIFIVLGLLQLDD